jgi:hypothetical protein
MNRCLQSYQHKITPTTKIVFLLITCISIVGGTKASTINTRKITPLKKDSILVKSALKNKDHDARLYPDSSNQNLLFTTTGNKKKSYQLFVFDMDGKLINQTTLPGRQTELLTSIQKGSYLFEIFNDDRRLENGSIVVK